MSIIFESICSALLPQAAFLKIGGFSVVINSAGKINSPFSPLILCQESISLLTTVIFLRPAPILRILPDSVEM